MKIDFGQAVGEIADQPCEAILGHMPRPLQAEHVIGCEQSGGTKATAQLKRKGCGEQRERGRCLWLDLSEHMPWLQRYARRAQAEAPPNLNHQSPDHRMKMEMLMRVAM